MHLSIGLANSTFTLLATHSAAPREANGAHGQVPLRAPPNKRLQLTAAGGAVLSGQPSGGWFGGWATVSGQRRSQLSADPLGRRKTVPAEHRDYTWEEWLTLRESVKRELIEQYWNPQKPQLGEATRGAILEAFGSSHPHLLSGVAESHTVYFTNWGWCIAVMVLDPSIRVPRKFSGFRVVKGITRTAENPLRTVKWLSR